MLALKFLAEGARGPISGFAWPRPQGEGPGGWVEAGMPLVLATRGVHVCRPEDLAHWLHDELWEVEHDGAQLEGLDCVVVERARLVRRIAAWSDGGAQRFAQACIEHARECLAANCSTDALAFLDDARAAMDAGYVAIAAFCCASAVSTLDVARAEGFRRARQWQSAWIARAIVGSAP